MKTEAPRADPSMRDDAADPGLAWMSALAENAMQVQRMQIEALLAWQTSAVAINNEVWDEWRCRFAGGAPIDV